MSSGGPPDRVPTLTEVVAWPQRTAASPADAQPVASAEAQPFEADALAIPSPALRAAEEQMIQGVLLELQRQVELMLDYRMREVLTPLLARAADGIVREVRTELASTLRDVVARAVAQELARHRTR
jgi:hypothetical protein